MENEKQGVEEFAICFGGISGRPVSSDKDGARSWEARSGFLDFLASEKNVGGVFRFPEGRAKELSGFCGRRRMYLEDGEEMDTYCWPIPMIFKLDVEKGFTYKDSAGDMDTIEGPLKAMVLYDGIWFMAAYDPEQFSDITERFFAGAHIREVLLDLMSRGGEFVPEVVAPCVMPVDVSLEVSRTEGGGDSEFPRYRLSVRRGHDDSELLVKYGHKKDKAVDVDIAGIMLEIYSSIRRNMQSYYWIEASSLWHRARRRKMIEEYREMCGVVKAYLEISDWNIVKKSMTSNKLGKEATRLQMKVVNNSLWDNKLIRESAEVDSYHDQMGIMDHIRGYLKSSISEPYGQSREEYEGFMNTISSIDKITSQHNFVLLSVIAVFAGLIGAIIGSLLG